MQGVPSFPSRPKSESDPQANRTRLPWLMGVTPIRQAIYLWVPLSTPYTLNPSILSNTDTPSILGRFYC